MHGYLGGSRSRDILSKKYEKNYDNNLSASRSRLVRPPPRPSPASQSATRATSPPGSPTSPGTAAPRKPPPTISLSDPVSKEPPEPEKNPSENPVQSNSLSLPSPQSTSRSPRAPPSPGTASWRQPPPPASPPDPVTWKLPDPKKNVSETSGQTRDRSLPCRSSPPRCPLGGGGQGEDAPGRPAQQPRDPASSKPRSPPSWTLAGCSSLANTGARHAATLSRTSATNKIGSEDDIKALQRTTQFPRGEGRTSPSTNKPKPDLKQILHGSNEPESKQQARAELSATNSSYQETWNQVQLTSSTVVATATTTTTSAQQEAGKQTIQQQIAKYNNMSKKTTTTPVGIQQEAPNRDNKKRKRNDQTTTTTTEKSEVKNNDDQTGRKKTKFSRKNQDITKMFEKIQQNNEKNENKQTTTTMNNEENKTTTKCEQQSAEETKTSLRLKQQEAEKTRKTTTPTRKSKQQQNNKPEGSPTTTRIARKQQEAEGNENQVKIQRYLKKPTQQKQQNNEEQRKQNNTSEEKQQQRQQQPPKMTTKSKGTAIPDVKKFLAKKRIERAARVGGENDDIKVNPAVNHTQPIRKFLCSAHDRVLEGITGRNEKPGSNSSAAKGISVNLCDKQ